MIRYEKGDLLKSNHRIFIHGVNCQGKMGAGIAKQIKEVYPQVYEDYITYTEQHGRNLKTSVSPLLGNIVITQTHSKKGDLPSYFLSLYTQEFLGKKPDERYVSYDAIDNAMLLVSEWLEWYEQKYGHRTSIGMPKIGAGLGGGNWSVIEAIINNRLANYSVYVYEL